MPTSIVQASAPCPACAQSLLGERNASRQHLRKGQNAVLLQQDERLLGALAVPLEARTERAVRARAGVEHDVRTFQDLLESPVMRRRLETVVHEDRAARLPVGPDRLDDRG